MSEQQLDRFRPLAFRWACAVLRDPDLAEDVVQEALVIAYQSRYQLREPAAFPGWLKRIVLSQCSRVRRRKGPAEVEFREEDLTVGETPATVSEQRIEHHTLREAVAALPAHERIVVQMFYLEGYALRDIARQLGLETGTVKKRLHSARQRLRGRLAEVFARE